MKMPTAKKAQEHVVIASFGSETNKKCKVLLCIRQPRRRAVPASNQTQMQKTPGAPYPTY
jgi:hypothetical protein